MKHSSCKIGLTAAALLCGVLGQTALAPAVAAPADRSNIRWRKTPRQALAFYYGWYGNPEISQRWVHWKNVDVARKHIDESTNYPVLGPYDSHDPKIVDIHCRQAKEAGLTGFIVSWWRQGDFHDEGMPLMLDTAARQGLAISVYYEAVAPRGKPTVEGGVDDLLYIMRKYAGHKAWLKVGGKPVIFIYGRAVSDMKLEGWARIMNDFTAKYPGGAVFIGDHCCPAKVS